MRITDVALWWIISSSKDFSRRGYSRLSSKSWQIYIIKFVWARGRQKYKSKVKYNLPLSKSYLLWPLAYFGGNISFLSIGLTLTKTAGQIILKDLWREKGYKYHSLILLPGLLEDLANFHGHLENYASSNNGCKWDYYLLHKKQILNIHCNFINMIVIFPLLWLNCFTQSENRPKMPIIFNYPLSRCSIESISAVTSAISDLSRYK